MTKYYNFQKQSTLVKGLPGASELRPQYIEDLDSFMFGMLNNAVEIWQEMKRTGAEIFEYSNRSDGMPKDMPFPESDEVHFHVSDFPLWGKMLSFDGKYSWRNRNWRPEFWTLFPQYHGSMLENWKETSFFHIYFHRYYKKDSKYNIVQDRVREHFRYLTQDPDVIFDLGWTSYIYWDPDKRKILDRFPCWYY